MKNTRKILLVEDNPSDVDLTKRALLKCHIANELVVARDGKEALDYLFGIGDFLGRNVAELPAITLLDLQIPKISGLEVLSRIRADARTRRMPIVILTSSREESDVSRGYDGGVNSYVVKPINFDQFQQAIDRLGLYWLLVNEPPPPVLASELE